MSRRGVVMTVVALVAVLAGGLWASGPRGPLPGGPFWQGAIPSPPDWTALDGQQTVVVESRARWLPYSSRAMVQVADGDAYLLLPSLFGDGLHRRLEENPAARIRVGDAVHTVRVERLRDLSVVTRLLRPYLWKFFALQIEDAEVRMPAVDERLEWSGGEVWFYRIPAARL